MSLGTSIKSIMLKRFFNGILAFFATSTVAAQSEPIKVLFIGNSYTHMNDMPKMFDKIRPFFGAFEGASRATEVCENGCMIGL